MALNKPSISPAIVFADTNVGRGRLGWEAGAEVRSSLYEVHPGDVLIQLTRHNKHTACNVVTCLMGATKPHVWGQIAYFQYLLPTYAVGGFAIWGWELRHDSRRLFRAVKADERADKDISTFLHHLPRFKGYEFGPRVAIPPHRERPELVRIPEVTAMACPLS